MLISAPVPDSVGYVTVLRGGGPLVVPGIQALDGVFMAMRREVAIATPFDEALFDHFHLYDLDFSFRAYRAGFALAVCRDIVLIHQSIGKFDAVWDNYRRRFETKHRAHLPDTWDAEDRRARHVLRDDARRDSRTLRSRAPRGARGPDRTRERRAVASGCLESADYSHRPVNRAKENSRHANFDQAQCVLCPVGRRDGRHQRDRRGRHRDGASAP